MKKILLATAALAAMASAAAAERYVMITHTQGTDPFWPVVEKGAKDAAAAVGKVAEEGATSEQLIRLALKSLSR